ncbi:uncharacterized protein LAESUDRAFT_717283 [Laetiporus sulphureus 93-53]|uniref:Uncharacterized protein n=1 Tax=Laetiporus sulphureus 93-53 TaxID=1314785 RepID=A0A165BX40_9APHY|nr:uncharacterized protein LAESUDRAFT_717283 [Laetiporus sulphureus 93-53]KZT01809.1 hypothetical protein LAESUDRAFT_717283 [Laetiporus sulphureus 93-53]
MASNEGTTAQCADFGIKYLSDRTGLVTIAKESIQGFLARLDFKAPIYVPDGVLIERVGEAVWPWGDTEEMQRYVRTGILIADIAYRHTSIDTKVAIALYTMIPVAWTSLAFLRNATLKTSIATV